MIVIPAFLDTDSDAAIAKMHALRAVAPWIQIDVADGTMTDSHTCDIYDFVGEVDDFDVEVHIMSTTPEAYFDACAAIDARRVYFHLNAVESPHAVLRAMDPYDFTKGIAISPQTEAHDVFPYIDDIDAVQIMTVVPGAQGGAFLPDMLHKVTHVRERRGDIWIGVDGGVNAQTIPEIKITGADAVGVGSALMQAKDMKKTYQKLSDLAQQ